MHCTQRAVWRKRGSGSPESLCEFGSLSPVRTAVEAPPAPSRWDVRCKRRIVRRKQARSQDVSNEQPDTKYKLNF